MVLVWREEGRRSAGRGLVEEVVLQEVEAGDKRLRYQGSRDLWNLLLHLCSHGVWEKSGPGAYIEGSLQVLSLVTRGNIDPDNGKDILVHQLKRALDYIHVIEPTCDTDIPPPLANQCVPRSVSKGQLLDTLVLVVSL